MKKGHAGAIDDKALKLLKGEIVRLRESLKEVTAGKEAAEGKAKHTYYQNVELKNKLGEMQDKLQDLTQQKLGLQKANKRMSKTIDSQKGLIDTLEKAVTGRGGAALDAGGAGGGGG